MSDPRPWRARVLRPGGGVAGAGVLIDERHVLTCAHVVNQALGRAGQEQEPPAADVQIDFVEAEGGPLGACVAEGGWVPIGPGGRGDVAVLELSSDALRGARPAVLRHPPRLGGHRFDTYGYPGRYDTGLGASGVLAAWGGPANLWVELQAVEVPGHRVERGFSGAAVYDQDAGAVVGIVVAEDKLAEAKLAWMLPVRTLSQLLGSSWPRLTDIVRSAAMYGPGELAGHWSPKARGVEREAKRGWYFTGRTKVLGELAAWLAGGQADGRVRVVIGGPGSGKSAVLARLVTLSDPLYRERVPDLHPNDPAVPPAGSIEVAVWARNKTIEDVVAAIAQATGMDAGSPDGMIDGLLERNEPCTIVVDALDEAVEPAGIAGKLLRPLAADAASAGVRVLVGTRPGREEELVHALGRDAVRFDLDQPPFLQRGDLVEFVRRRLLLTDEPGARTPYRERELLAGRVAEAVADRAYPTFLVAQLTSKALVQVGSVVDVEVPGWELTFPGSVADAMDGYLNRLAEDAPSDQERRTRKRRLRELLTPLAYAEGDGLPRRLWPAAATALAERSYGTEDLDWLLDTAADYMIEQATSEGGPVYRLYHQALADYLRPVNIEMSALQRRLATALLKEVPRRPNGISRDWSVTHPYLTKHLATHAAAAGRLDELLEDPGFLLAADPARLLRALPTVTNPVAQAAARAYQQAAHQLTPGWPLGQRASCLQRAARYAGATDLAERVNRLGFELPWTTKWAHWQASGTFQQLIGHHGTVWSVAVGQIDDQPVIVSGSLDGTVRVWDARSDRPQREPLIGHHGIVWSVAVGQIDGQPVIISGGEDRTVRVWDARSGRPRGQPLTGHTGSVKAVAIGQLDGQPMIISGDLVGMVRVWDARSGRPRGEPLTGHTDSVYGLAVGQVADQPVIVSAGHDRTIRVWDARAGEQCGIETDADTYDVVCTGEGLIVAATALGLSAFQLNASER
jgi:hypothetical protein